MNFTSQEKASIAEKIASAIEAIDSGSPHIVEYLDDVQCAIAKTAGFKDSFNDIVKKTTDGLAKNKDAITAASALAVLAVPTFSIAKGIGKRFIDPIKLNLSYKRMKSLGGPDIQVPSDAHKSFFVNENLPKETRDELVRKKVFGLIHHANPKITGVPELAKHLTTISVHLDPQTLYNTVQNIAQVAPKMKIDELKAEKEVTRNHLSSIDSFSNMVHRINPMRD